MLKMDMFGSYYRCGFTLTYYFIRLYLSREIPKSPNIARHAQAKNVFTTLNVEKSHISLTIKDDGIGLPAKILANPTSLGIIGMQERASLVNGKLKISSSHDKGTTIQLTIPMEITYIQCIQDE